MLGCHEERVSVGSFVEMCLCVCVSMCVLVGVCV